MIIQLFPPVFVVFSRDVWQTMWHCAWAREKDSNKHFQTKAVYFPSESGVFVCKILCGDVAGKRHPLYKSYICIEPLTACCWWPWPTLSSTIFSIGKLLHTWNFEFRPCHIPPSVEFMSIYDKKKTVGFGRLTLRRIIPWSLRYSILNAFHLQLFFCFVLSWGNLKI